MLHGDRYDAIITATILEHWFHVLSRQDSWSEVNYFFPYTRTIAQTDGYFLIGMIYSPFRFLGLDAFLSSELAGCVIKSSGFIGTYLLCRKAFSFPFYWALLAAALFTLSNGMTVHTQRLQLSTAAFSPILALLLWGTLKAFFGNNIAKFRVLGTSAGIFFGAWCLTCFYMAWFFAFFFTIFTIIILINSRKLAFTLLKKNITTHYGSVIFVFAVTFISLLPFIYAFFPKSLEVGVRSYHSAAAWTVPLKGILQVGNENFLFGSIYNQILHQLFPNYSPNGEYYNTGFSFILFFIFLCGCMKVIKQICEKNIELILTSLMMTTIVTWLAVLNFFGHSAWFFVYYLFPGAKALNVVATYQIFLAFPVIIIAIKYLSNQHIALPIVILISGLLIVEEINQSPAELNRKTELARILIPHSPPSTCHVFYTSAWKDQNALNKDESNWIKYFYAHNVTAMMIAQITGIPTINGVASFSPPDWDFGYPNHEDYDKRILAYAKKHHITGLCRLDLNSKQWVMVIK